MKRYFYSIALGLLSVSAMNAQQDWSGVPVLPDSYAHKIGKDGTLIAGETGSGNYFTYNVLSGERHLYIECVAGMGNPIAENGWLVGNEEGSSSAVIMSNGEKIHIPSLNKYSESYLYGITWDAKRICGIISNVNEENSDIDNPDYATNMYLPVILNVSDNGEVGEPIILPTPPKDFFGAKPQYCSAVWISDDGKTVAGQVIDNSGLYIYPIVYKEKENGEWSYSLPSEPLFNPDDLPMPEYPPFEMKIYQVEDFMTPEKAEEFRKDLENWNGDEEDSPYNLLFLYMNEEELTEYETWLKEYLEYNIYYNDVLLTQYYQALTSIINSSAFFEQGSLAIDRNGEFLACPQEVSYIVPGELTPVVYYIPWIFDLQNGTFRKVGSEYSRLNTNQILPDGTVIACTPNVNSFSPDSTPVHSYVLLPGSDNFIEIAEWMKTLNPSYAEWMEEYLYQNVPIGYENDGVTWIYKEMYVTGQVSVSEDLSTFVGGVDSWSWNYDSGDLFTYILKDVPAGVEEIKESIKLYGGIYNVYNLQGVKVLSTPDSNAINSLEPGLYIVNGKKILVNR